MISSLRVVNRRRLFARRMLFGHRVFFKENDVIGTNRTHLCLLALACGMTLVVVGSAQEPSNAKSVDEWRKLLKAADPSLRWQAAEALGQLGKRQPKAVVWDLSKAVRDDDLDVRLQAVASLAGLGAHAENAVPALGTALKDKDSDLRRQASQALAGAGPLAEEAVALLGETLQDPNANVRLAAIGALQAIGPDSARATTSLLGSLKDKVPSVRRASAAALAVILVQADPQWTEKAAPALAAALRDNDPEVRRRAAFALGRIGAPAEAAVDALGEAARTALGPARNEAALALGRIGGKAVLELARNLTHADAAVRASAAAGLQLLGYRARPVFGALSKALMDGDPAVRRQAAAALRACDPEPTDILPILKLSVEAKEDDVGRSWAIVWLGEIGVGIDKQQSNRAMQLLAFALADQNAGIRAQAAVVLGNIGSEASPAVKVLREHVDDPDPNVRQQAAIALGKIDPQAAREAIPLLLQALTRPTFRNRSGDPFDKDVAITLATIGFVEPLVDALEKSDSEALRAGVTFALVQMGPRAKGAFKFLRAALQNREASVRQRSAYALQAIRPDPKEAVPVLVESLRHEDDLIRRWAAAFLADLAGEATTGPETGDALEALAGVLKKEAVSDVRAQAVRAVGAILAHLDDKPKAPLEQELVQELIARVADVNAEVRQQAVLALGQIGAARKGQGPIRQALPVLLETLKKGRPFQVDAALALGRIGLAAPLIDALKQSDSERVRAGAAYALELIGPEASAYLQELMAALKDPDAHVRHRVALALASLGRLAAAAVPVLTAALEDIDPVVPPGAALALANLGPEADTAAPALAKALASSSHPLRQQAQAALVAIGPEAVPALRETLKTQDSSVTILAADALARIGGKGRPAIPELLLAFNRGDLYAKNKIAEVLTVLKAKVPEAIPALTLAVSHADVNLAASAVALLQDLKAATPAVVTALAARLNVNPNAYADSIDLCRLIVRALGKLGLSARTAVPALVVSLDVPELMPDAAQALRAVVGPEAKASELVKALQDQHQVDDRQVALILGAAGADAVPVLVKYLEHPRARVRAAAVLSLGRQGFVAEDAQPSVIKTMADVNRQVRLNAVEALAQRALDQKKQGKKYEMELAALDQMLAHWDEATRVEAGLKIAKIVVKEGKTVLPFSGAELIALLKHKPGDVLVAALKEETVLGRQQVLIKALTALAEARIDLQLAKAMTDDDSLARERIALALGAVTSAQDLKAAVASLGAALADRHVALRRQAARSLARLAQMENGALAELLKVQVPALEIALGERDRVVVHEAALAHWRITRQADKALPVLSEHLKSLSYVGPEFIEQLRNSKFFVEALLAAGVSTDDPAIKDALVFLSRSQSLPGELHILELANPAVIALVEMAEQTDQPFVIALKHSDERVRAGAAVILGAIKKPSAARLALPLADALKDRSAVVRQQAASALRYLELDEKQQELVISHLDKILADHNIAVRRQAASTLGVIGPHSAQMKVDDLQKLLKDRDAGVRAAAVEALGRFGPKASVTIPLLQRALKDQVVLVRRQAATTLGKIGAASLPALKEALNDKDFDTRRQTAVALGNMGAPAKEAVPALRAALKDKDQEVSTAAADALKLVESSEN